MVCTALFAVAPTGAAGKLVTVVSVEFNNISTTGGAFLEWLEGKALPGVKALEV